MIDPQKSESKLDYDDIKALKELGESYWDQIHREYKDDIKFSYGTGTDQWDPKALMYRGGRPAESYNIINGFVTPVVSLAQQNPPAMNVFPISDGASKANARAISGVLRAIEYSCGAQREYCSALESAVRGSIGVLKVIPRLSDTSDDDDIDFVIHHVADPTCVLIDPSARKADFSDANWVIVKTSMSERQYKRDYPDGRADGLMGMVTVYEMWIKERKTVKELDPETGYTVRKRKTKILQYLFDDVEILETIDDYAGKYLPFAIVTGPRYTIDGETRYNSMTRVIKGIQKEINFLKSEQIATIACAPKATFYGDNNAFDSQEEQEAWEESATNPRVFLGHKPGSSVNQFNMPQIPTAYIESVDKSVDLARVITGIYPDPTTQNGLSPMSGKAIKQQQAGQSIATYAFVDSLNYAIKHIGEIILDLLPHYWNDNKVRLSMGVDGKFAPISMGDTEVEGADNFDMAYGKYSVSISTGPSYASQKEALIEMIMDTIKTNPQAMQIALPWIINQINLPGSEELADMFSLTLPDNIQKFIAMQKQTSSDPAEALKAAMFQLQKMAQDGQEKSQMIDQLTKALDEETNQLKSKEQELQGKREMEQDKQQHQMMLEAIKHEHNLEIAELKARVDAFAASMKNEQAEKDRMAELGEKYRQEQNELLKKDMEHNALLDSKQVDHANKMAQISHQGSVDTLKAHLAPVPAQPLAKGDKPTGKSQPKKQG